LTSKSPNINPIVGNCRKEKGLGKREGFNKGLRGRFFQEGRKRIERIEERLERNSRHDRIEKRRS